MKSNLQNRRALNIFSVFLTMIWLALTMGTTQATTWDAATDFSATNNPAGAWSYGWSSASLRSEFHLYPNTFQDNGLDQWNDHNIAVLFAPNVGRNSTANTITVGGQIFPPGGLFFHPGMSDEYSIVRWTAQAAGVYSVAAVFTAINSDWNGTGTTTDVHILHNGVPIFDGLVNGYLSTASSSNAGLSIASGDFIDFVVGYGTNNNFFGDTTGLSATITDNSIPIANAGADQSIHAGTMVHLDGSASFDDNTPSTALHYSWSFSSVPAGNTAVLNNANTSTPRFTPNVSGEYVVQLIVTDDAVPPLFSTPAFVTLSSFNQAPTAAATATPLIPYVGQKVSLNGTGSTDPDNDSLGYAWTVTSWPPTSSALLFDDTLSNASFMPDVPGTYNVTLTVSDFLGAGTPATVSIVATTAAAFAEAQTASASAIVAALPPAQLTTTGNRTALGNFLIQAMQATQNGNVTLAIVKLNQAIERTDGCVLRGSPDGNGAGRDWITDCTAQNEAYNLLNDALNALIL